MTSIIKVDDIQNQPGTNIINKCSTTITVGAACNSVVVTGNVVKSNALQAADAGNIISQSGTTVTLGASGDTVALASGATQTGFGNPGQLVDWQTGSIKTATFSAVDGEGYFVNTTSGVVTVNLPAGSAGAIVAVNDYASTSATNNITISADGSEKIQGSTDDHIIDTNGVTITLVYVDGTQGWKLVDTGESASLPQVALFTVATGGTPCAGTTSGDYKIHTFTGPGTFCVSVAGNAPVNPAGGPNQVDYLVVAGGGGGGSYQGGGAGGAGFRESHSDPISGPYTASPLATATAHTVTASPYTITVGAGGAYDNQGATSTFSTIDSAGGGKGGMGAGTPAPLSNGGPGGSGGGGSNSYLSPGAYPGGTGNTPPTAPPQGQTGGNGTGSGSPSNLGNAAGGGGAGGTGTSGSPAPNPGGGKAGGAGVTTSAPGSPTAFAGAGGGGAFASGSGGSGGSGGGGAGGSSSFPHAATAGGTNLGGGGGGSGRDGSGVSTTAAAGGSGLVIIRYKFQ